MDYLLDQRLSDHGTYMFLDIYNALVAPQFGERGDVYYILYDFKKYVEAQERVDAAYRDRLGWAKKCLMNLANCGHFSSDRTIREYVEDIWHLESIQ